MPIESEDLRTLADIGFIAAAYGMNEHAIAIFDAIRALRPNQEAGFLGCGLVGILSGNAGTAIEMLRSAPPTDGVGTFLGIALIQNGETHEGRELLEEIIATAPDTPFAAIAASTLENLQG